MKTTNEQTLSKPLISEVFEALGEASTCWIPKPSSQVFDSTKATKIGDELMEKISSDIPNAMAALGKALLKFKGGEGDYYHACKYNIAMSFFDECERFCRVNKKKNIHPGAFAEIGNNAAKKFLDLLIK